jgi:ferritin-like metal-binding protein YciE
MSVSTVEELFVEELRDIYHAEKQLLKVLPKMAKAASQPQLGQALTGHLEETRGQIERLEQIFDGLDLGKRGKRCEAMEGLIEEARSMMDEVEDPQVLDIGMIIGARKVEHYEIASYGALITLAVHLGHEEAAALLRETVAEETAAAAKLERLATAALRASTAAGDDATAGGEPPARDRSRKRATAGGA